MSDVFISYARVDNDGQFVTRLADELKAKGKDVWVDYKDIPFAQDFVVEFIKGLDESDTILIILSPDYLVRPNCQKELQRAVANNKRIVPLLYRDIEWGQLDERIRNLNAIFCREGEGFNGAIESILNTLDTDLPHIREHTRLLTRALEWETNGHNNSYLLTGTELQNGEAWLVTAGTKYPTPNELHVKYILESRTASTRYQRRLLGGVTTALVVTGILAVLAFLSFQRSEEQRLISEQRGTAVAQQAGTATVAQGQAQQNASTAVIAQGQAEQNATLSANNAATAVSNAVTAVAAQGQAESAGATSDANAATAISAESTSSFNVTRVSIVATTERQTARRGIAEHIAVDADTSFPWTTLALALEANAEPQPPGKVQALLSEAAYLPGINRIYDIHADSVVVVKLNSDASKIVTGSLDGSVLITDRATGIVLNRFGGNLRNIHDVDISEDGTWVLAATKSGLYIWDVKSGQLFRHIDADHDISSAVFLPDDFVAIGYYDESKFVIQDLITGTTSVYFQSDSLSPVFRIMRTLDSQILFTFHNNSELVLWDTKTGQVRHSILDFIGVLQSASISADGSQILVSDTTGKVKLLDAATGAVLWTSATFTGDSWVTGFTEDGKYFFASFGNIITVWDARTQEEKTLIGHVNNVYSAVYDNHNQQIISGGLDATVIVWDLRIGDLLSTFSIPDEIITIAVLSPSGAWIGIGSQHGDVIILNSKTGLIERRWNAHTRAITSLIFSPDETQIATAGADDLIFVWDITSGQKVQEFSGHISVITDLHFSLDGKRLLSASEDTTVRIWSLTAKENAVVLESPLFGGRWLSANFVGLSNTVIGINDDQYVVAMPGDSLRVRISDNVTAGYVFPDGNSIAVGYKNGTIDFIDGLTGSLTKSVQAHTAAVISMAVSADSAHLVTLAANGEVKVWDMATSEEYRQYPSLGTNWKGVSTDAKAEILLAYDAEGSISLWRIHETLESLVDWIHSHRYVGNLSCLELLSYGLVTTCESTSS